MQPHLDPRSAHPASRPGAAECCSLYTEQPVQFRNGTDSLIAPHPLLAVAVRRRPGVDSRRHARSVRARRAAGAERPARRLGSHPRAVLTTRERDIPATHPCAANVRRTCSPPPHAITVETNAIISAPRPAHPRRDNDPRLRGNQCCHCAGHGAGHGCVTTAARETEWSPAEPESLQLVPCSWKLHSLEGMGGSPTGIPCGLVVRVTPRTEIAATCARLRPAEGSGKVAADSGDTGVPRAGAHPSPPETYRRCCWSTRAYA